jgi:uncharacterized protein YcbX
MHLSELNIYPVKSLKGIALSESVVEDRGLRHDRRWMLVDEKNQFLTQREHPVMARIKIKIDGDRVTAGFDGREIEMPLTVATDEYHTVKIWNSTVRGQFYPAEIDRWFSEILGIDCRLVAMPEGAHRAVSPFYAVRRFKDEVSFADGYPFMVLGQASLDDLNSRLASPVPMNRFRPNFVVSGSEAFAEDNWRIIRIGTTVFHVVKPSERCVLTTVDQALGEKTGKEPLRTLSIYRNVKGKVLFGQNLIAENPGGVVRIGDEVEVLEWSRASRP